MPTAPVPTKPDGSTAERSQRDAPAPRDRNGVRREPAPEVLGPAPSDRTVDADLLIDIPQLSVEELTLELEASQLLNRVKLDAKGLDLGLYVKGNFDRLVALAQERSGKPRGTIRSRTGLRELLGATRQLSDGGVQEQPREVHVTTEDEPPPAENRDDGHERTRHAVTQGVKAAGLTAAGLAGGALLESRTKLSVPRRNKGVRMIRDAIAKRLP